MNKRVCKSCGAIFDRENADIVIHTEYYEFWGREVSREVEERHCPECGGSDYEAYFGDIDDGGNISEEKEESE